MMTHTLPKEMIDSLSPYLPTPLQRFKQSALQNAYPLNHHAAMVAMDVLVLAYSYMARAMLTSDASSDDPQETSFFYNFWCYSIFPISAVFLSFAFSSKINNFPSMWSGFQTAWQKHSYEEIRLAMEKKYHKSITIPPEISITDLAQQQDIEVFLAATWAAEEYISQDHTQQLTRVNHCHS